MHFSENLDYLMKIRQISGKELGEFIEKGQSMVSKYRNGATSPTLEIAYKVCKFLNVDIGDMVMRDLRDYSLADIKKFNQAEEPQFMYGDNLEREVKYLRSRLHVLELLLERYAPDAVIQKYLR